MSAHSRLDLAGDAAIPTFPMTPPGSPGFRVISVQFSPPSVDLKIPLCEPPDTSFHGVR